MDVVISFKEDTKEYQFYEPTTDTLLISNSLGEGFANLNFFLVSSGKVNGSILNAQDISYHIDSTTFKSIVESNVNLIRRLQQNGQSEFKTSSDKFAAASQASAKKFGMGPGSSFGKSFGSSQFGGSKSKFGKSEKKWKT